jgi:hypothetical protein
LIVSSLFILIYFAVVDSTGTALRRQLEQRHERFCGWIDNASPGAFLAFPEEAAAVLGGKYLQRARSLLRAVERVESRSLDAGISLFDFTAAKSIIQKYSATSPHDKVCELALRIADGVAGNKAAGSDLRLQRLWGALKDGKDESALLLLSSLLSPLGGEEDGEAEAESALGVAASTQPPAHYSNITYLAFAAALFGWEAHDVNSHSIARCGICGSSAALEPQSPPRPCDVVRDHRFYCPWVNETGSTDGNPATVGWVHCASSVLSYSADASSGTSVGPSTAVTTACRDPVASFNRINSVISMMARPPAPQTPSSS